MSNFVIEFGENGRPKTGGAYRSKDRYQEKKNMTISHQDRRTHSIDNENRNRSKQARKTIYDEF